MSGIPDWMPYRGKAVQQIDDEVAEMAEHTDVFSEGCRVIERDGKLYTEAGDILYLTNEERDAHDHGYEIGHADAMKQNEATLEQLKQAGVKLRGAHGENLARKDHEYEMLRVVTVVSGIVTAAVVIFSLIHMLGH